MTSRSHGSVTEVLKLLRDIASLLRRPAVWSRELRQLDSRIAEAAVRARLRIYAAKVAAEPAHEPWRAQVRQQVAEGIPEGELLDREGLEQFFASRRSQHVG